MKTKSQAWLMALTCLLLAHSAQANTNTVTTLADGGPGSLRDAITNNSAAGDTINFDAGLTGGTITLTSGELVIDHTLTIVGPGFIGPAAISLTVSGFTSRVFNISAGATVAISGLTISGGMVKGADGTGANPNGEAASGGGILTAGTLTLMNCKVANNKAIGGNGFGGGGQGGRGWGGGICNTAIVGSITLVNCQVANNVVRSGDFAAATTDFAGARGGGIFSFAALALTNCTLNNNMAQGGNTAAFTSGGPGYGGGIFLFAVLDPASSFVNCTIASNTAAMGSCIWIGDSDGGAEGGGVLYNGGKPLTLTSCTISRNDCVETDGKQAIGGGIVGPGSLKLENTIVASNLLFLVPYPGEAASVTIAGGPDVAGNVNSGGFNFIGEANNSSGWITSGIGMDLTGTPSAPLDPKLGPLQDNGGPTPTMAPAVDSPVIDQGTNFGITTDQRGSPRSLLYNSNLPYPPGGDSSDIGAFELYAPRPLLTIRMVKSSLPVVKVGWTPDPVVRGGHLPGHAFALQTAASLNGGTTWEGYKAPVKYMVNNEIVATDPVGDGSGKNFRLTDDTNGFNIIFQTVTLSASNIMTTSASLNGTTIPSDTNTVYWFEWGTDTNYYGGTNLPASLDTSTNPAPVSYQLYGLSASTLYHFQLVVTDTDGTQLGGDQQFTTLGLPPAVSTTPGPQVFSNCPTCFSALLKGTVNPESSPTVAWFYYYSDTFTGETTPQNVGSGNSTNGVQQAVFNLTLGATYYFQIVASNSAGISYGNYQTFTAAPSVPPVVVTTNATYVSCGGDCAPIPVLNGTVNGNGASFTGYFQYGLNTNNYSFDTSQYPFNGNNSSPQPFSFTMNNVTLNTATTYHYRIVAFNGTDEGIGGDKTFLSP
jgi:hypothetical protein